MRALRDLPIKKKLIIITMVTSGTALLLACAGFVANEHVTSRQAMVAELKSTARMIGDNSAAALSFREPSSAEQTLRSLSANPHIVAGVVYDVEGHPFATYRRPAPRTERFEPPPLGDPGHRFGNNFLEVTCPIDLAGEVAGTVYLRSDLEAFRALLVRYGFIVALMVLVSSVVALLLSLRLQQVISEPISHLAKVAGLVGTEKNYTIRAVKRSEDEMGQLMDGFNEMLTQIEERERALRAAHDELEKRVAQRTQELAESLALLHATLESTTDGIMAYDLNGRVVCGNQQIISLMGMPKEVLVKRNQEDYVEWAASQVVDEEEFRRLIQQRQPTVEPDVCDVVRLRSGRILERYLRPQRVGDKRVGSVVIYRDITEKKRMEREMERTHQDLVRASRQAGMAEVATSVLHNVGNVLNSVNTSVNVMKDEARDTQVDDVAKVADLLEQHQDRLPEFLAEEKRGTQLVVYLRSLARHLASNRTRTLQELTELAKNIDHIKDIVGTQQTYAKVSGVMELVMLTELVDDALGMHARALTRHEIHITRNYAPGVPPLTLEKHKVLQILMNLIHNAKYACDESGKLEKQMTISIQPFEDRVRVVVADNGIGIKPENLTKIFNHGFTTRKNGHGFGLHSAALAAREMHGTLLVHSDGPGQGAAFTLELPLTANPSRS